MNTTTHRQRDIAQKLTAREIRSRQARPINIRQVEHPPKDQPLVQLCERHISRTQHDFNNKSPPKEGTTTGSRPHRAAARAGRVQVTLYTENDLFSERGRQRHQAGDQAKEDKHILTYPLHHSIRSVDRNFCVTKSRRISSMIFLVRNVCGEPSMRLGQERKGEGRRPVNF
jgi:hypothetical protein